MKRSVYFFVCLSILLASCSGVKKFDYATAYNFKKVRIQSDHQNQQVPVSDSKGFRTFEKPSVAMKLSNQQNFHQTAFNPVTKIERVEISPVENIIAGLPTDMSKKEVKKHIKKEIKALKKQQPEKLSSKKKPAKVASEISGNLRTGLILGGVGIILLILGGTNGVLAAVGTILILAGVVFVLLDLL